MNRQMFATDENYIIVNKDGKVLEGSERHSKDMKNRRKIL